MSKHGVLSATETIFDEGFTLIELSIVLVIIGLIVGGVLVGQDLIRAAAVRAQISQIEKYQAAVNTFEAKYGALPGDMNAATAAQFGFAARPSGASCVLSGCQAQGDGNGVIEGFGYTAPYLGANERYGETVMFWVDLTTANGLNLNLIDGSFSAASFTTAGNSSITALANYFPQSKLGQGNYIYVSSGGDYISPSGLAAPTNSINYFALSALTNNNPGNTKFNITVQQAYNIDAKMDDGYPMSGRVIGSIDYVPFTSVVSGSSDSATTCYNTSTTNGVYSITYNNGAGANCGLLFQFQ